MKRRLAKLALFVLLGAVVNVAVAWGFAFVHPCPGSSTFAAIVEGNLESPPREIRSEYFGVELGKESFRLFAGFCDRVIVL